ncbi:MAG: glycosyltransferase, partial [Halobacteriaceae archaeon]
QIKVAEQLPDISFTVIGSVASTDYYSQCVRYIENNNIQNVTLRPDASSEVVKENLEERRIFFHSMKNEPFGISTVEGLNAGCIPVTHDSGGQCEIVSDSRLRYTSKSECVNTIKQVENREYTLDTDDIRAQLENYTTPHFRTQLQECVNHA